MEKRMFSAQGNLIGDRVRLGRAMHKPPLSQQQLAIKLQETGLEITKIMISRIESQTRHVIDSELRALGMALGVSMEWLVGDTEDPKRK